MNVRTFLCVVWLIASGVRLAEAADAPQYRVPQVRLPLMAKAPTIDGEVKEDEWSGAARMERFAWQGLLSPQEASFYVGCDGKELFLAIVSETPPGGKILQRIIPVPEDGDARTWMDDSIELVLDPLHDDTTGRRRLYHANINARGAINDTAYVPHGAGEGWRGHWRIASKVIGDRWHFEAALPLKDMNVTEGDLAKPFGVRVCRNWMQQAEGPGQSEWGTVAGAFLNPDTMPLVTWDAKAPVVQVLQLHDSGQQTFHARVAIRNTRAEAINVQTVFQCIPKSSAPTNQARPVKIGPGAVEMVEFSAAGLAGEEVYGSIQIASPDGASIYYLRDFRWKLGRMQPAWVLDTDAAKKIDVSFAYFPYHDTIKSIVGFNGLAEKEKVTAATLSVRGKGEAKALATTQLSGFKNFGGETEWKIPALKEGEYEFVVELAGPKVDPIVVPFVRHVMQWEHNALGKSDVVVAPFEPIHVDGEKVSTVLRTHAMNALGLWDQIETLGKPILKKPMRLEVIAGGKPQEVAAQKLEFTEIKPTAANARSSWKAGELTGNAQSQWDYDGVMRWTLELQPSKQPVDAITLVIPLDDKMMPLMHACTDGLRFNYAGATPAGQGRVWDGSKAARNSIIGSYVPYIWLGEEERGLAVFGDNDRGWVRDAKVPCQELVRSGDGTLELKLNLIAASITIDSPRRITIGFQATPTKPMPQNWRTWMMGGAGPGVDVDFRILGTAFTLGTLGPCSEIYPRNEDFSLYEKLAETRRTGEIDKDYIEKFIAGYPQGMDAYFTTAWPPHVNYTFRTVAAKPLLDGIHQRVIQYTNGRGVRLDTREGQTFLDEWHRDAFPTRNWPLGGSVAYDLDPVESFRDYAMFYYKKMLDTWLDDIYWDDIFMQSNFDTVGTDAYELPDGAIQPSSGLFNMRALIRRTAILNHEQGKRGYNMAHMTNTAIAPILSFCGTILTWEDRSGDADFQDRFSRDYIRAESIGRQTGNVPFCLTLVQSPDEKKKAWVLRTLAGVTLTHEIRPMSPAGPDYYKGFKQLVDFGYGKPDVRVLNYWDADYPAKIEGTPAASLIASKPGSAIIVVCDYGSGGDIKLTLAESLGLGASIKATDMESNQPLTVVGGGATVEFPLRKHDFKMVLVESVK